MYRPWILTATAVAALFLARTSATADEGMWLFENPPLDAIEAGYGVRLDDAWLEHVRKSCVRLSSGGSGSIVSRDGLVLTNHHVGSDMIAKLSTAERDLMANGFHAKSHAEELPCPDLEVLVLWEIEDMTSRVLGAVPAGADPAAAGAARRAEISRIEKERQEATGLKSEMVTLYQGARYHLYSYRRYTDVRLVWAPEKTAAFFGGDPDNFEYPRYCLDAMFFRIWEDGKPLRAEHYLEIDPEGADDGELVFVAGHPGSTERLNTVAHLEFFRDVRYPRTLASLWRREVQLENFSARSDEWRRIAEDDLFGIKNSRKALWGRLEGLNDPAIMDKKRAEERELRAFVDGDAERKAKWGDAWAMVERAQVVARENFDLTSALGGGGSQLFSFARTLVRGTTEREKPSAERLPEYNDAALPRLEQRLFSTATIYPDLEVEVVHSWLMRVSELLGGDHDITKKALGGKSPRARAEELVRGSPLLDPEKRRELWKGGARAVGQSDDAMLRLVASLDPEARRLRKTMDDEVDSVQRVAYAKIAEARFALHGDRVYPDATFTLRLSYGRIRGYQEGDKWVPPFTEIAGKFERSKERGGVPPYDLPASWVEAKDRLDGSVPYNFVSTNDIIGGNSGSPVVDAEGRVVGLVFDGNIHMLVGAMAYVEDPSRAVSVDTRAILEALAKVYRADALLAELAPGRHD
jgi:hypothetical protein